GYQAAAALPAQLEAPDDATLEDVLSLVNAALPSEAQLPGSCLVAVNGQHVGVVAAHRQASLRDGDELALIAPVAGG
ncbi:MAG: MoaD/ThiS family protein, partial [Planctomycetales bacterium]|nr:MoaD/ThiS family protein [Planctomycetales bacterium]